jgi:hypothetical protein
MAVGCVAEGDVEVEGVEYIGLHIDDFVFGDIALALDNQAAYFGRVYFVVLARQ